jgi:hypothetical protein
VVNRRFWDYIFNLLQGLLMKGGIKEAVDKIINGVIVNDIIEDNFKE